MSTNEVRVLPSTSGCLLTVEEAASYLGTGERFIRRLVGERRIGFVKLGSKLRFERADLDAFVNAGRVEAQEPDPRSKATQKATSNTDRSTSGGARS